MISLRAEKRALFGKKVKRLRQKGLVPAELYGHGLPNLHLSLPAKDFRRAYAEVGEHAVFNLEVDDKKLPVLIHDVQIDPVGGEILAVDFYQVRMDEKTRAHVPVEFVGESPAVKEQGGILVKNLDELEVEALPIDLPPKIVVDLSSLVHLDQSIYLKDLPRAEKFQFVADPETVIASVIPPAAEEAAAEETAPETGAISEVANKKEETGEQSG
jgi:large subunit ribosomal protein L25